MQEETKYKGVTEFTPLLFSVCSACGSEQADAEQVRVNKRTMIAFKKKVDGLLSGSEVKA